MDELNQHYLDDARIDLYLNNRMTESERAAFEVALLDDTALLQRVQLIDAFKQGLHSDSAALGWHETAAVREQPAYLSLNAWIRQPLSLAASVLVAGLGINALSTGLSSPDVLPLRSVVVLEGIRGADSVAFNGAGPYLFQVDAGLGTGSERYDLSLRNLRTGALVMVQQDLQADGNGWVRVALDEELQGEFSVNLAWRDSQGTARIREYQVAFTAE